jgi:hypothetical protein
MPPRVGDRSQGPSYQAQFNSIHQKPVFRSGRSRRVDAEELRAQAADYRRWARRVTDEHLRNGLIDLAEKYEAIAASVAQEDGSAGEESSF